MKFDYRTDPEDQPIAEDYVRELGLDTQRMKDIALLLLNETLQRWLTPLDLWDFCIIIGDRPAWELPGHF